jgi:hypothetical protein
MTESASAATDNGAEPFATMDVEDFKGTSPVLLPEEYLVHHLEGWGLVEHLTGGLQQRFTVKAHGDWDQTARILTFIETWTFDDGRKDTLAWRIFRRENGQYVGSETRLEGDAEGEQSGCAFHWRYSRDTPLNAGKSMLLNFNDWFFRIDERVVIIRGSAGRAGMPFSILHATYRRI